MESNQLPDTKSGDNDVGHQVSALNVDNRFLCSDFSLDASRALSTPVNRVMFAASSFGDESRAQADYERQMLRGPFDSQNPSRIQEFTRQYTPDTYFNQAFPRACPQAIGNDVLFMLMSQFELDSKNTQPADYDPSIQHPSVVSSPFIPSKNFIELMFAKAEDDNIRLIGMNTSFNMMHCDDEGNLSIIALAYNPETDHFELVNTLDHPGMNDDLDQFFSDLKREFNRPGKKFISFDEILTYCKSQPKDKPLFLPITSSMIDFEYVKGAKSVRVNDVRGLHPAPEGLMAGYHPIIASPPSLTQAKQTVSQRDFLFRRLGDPGMPKALDEINIRGQRYSQVNTGSSTHTDYAKKTQAIVDRAINEHQANQPSMLVFFRTMRESIINRYRKTL